jgi:predicted metal-dependent peptidase
MQDLHAQGYDTDIVNKIEKVRVDFHNKAPFFEMLSHYVKFIETTSISTAGIDPKGNLYYNPNFFARLDWESLSGIVAHELMHLVCVSIGRRPIGADAMLWNIAADCAINYILFTPAPMGAGFKLPDINIAKPVFSGCCPELAKYDNWVHEAIYADMYKNAEKIHSMLGGGPGNGAQGGGDGVPDDSNSSGEAGKDKFWWDCSAELFNGGHEDGAAEGMTEDEAYDWQNRVYRSADAARSIGSLPGALEKFFEKLLRPKKNWKKELTIAATPYLRPQYTWRRPGRRTVALSPHVRTPGTQPDLPRVVLAGDTSGSMSNDNVRRFMSEAVGIIKLFKTKVYLILHDARVYYAGEVDEDVIKSIEVRRGGTSFVPTFEHIAEMKEQPAILVYFSDMEGTMPDVPPLYPVIWCKPEGYGSLRYHTFGRVIEVED